MKVGDLVKWSQVGLTPTAEQHGGIIVDGPREGTNAHWPAISYAVHWFVAQETMWHNDYNLELTSESR